MNPTDVRNGFGKLRAAGAALADLFAPATALAIGSGGGGAEQQLGVAGASNEGQLALKNGQTHAGPVKQEVPEWLELNSTDDGFLTLRKSDITERQRGQFGMPEGFGQSLSKRDLRDLVEFLVQLK